MVEVSCQVAEFSLLFCTASTMLGLISAIFLQEQYWQGTISYQEITLLDYMLFILYSWIKSRRITDISAASRARDCGNPTNLVALAQIRVDRAPDGTRSSRSWCRLRD